MTALLSFCGKKKYPQSAVVNGTVYGFTAMIGNKAVSLSAGVNNYYMYSSYSQDSSGIYNFLGELKQTGCSNCPNSLKIQINDFKVSAVNGPMVLDSILLPRSYSFYSAIFHYEAQFQSQFN